MNNTLQHSKQLTLHAGLGAITGEILHGEAAAGAVGGVVGELTGEKAFNNGHGMSKQKAIALANLTSALAGAVVGGNANAVYAGSDAGSNAAANNALGELFAELAEDPYMQKELEETRIMIEQMPEEAMNMATTGAVTTAKTGYAAGMEFLPPGPVSFGDMARMGLGVDPYTGERTNRRVEAGKYITEGGFIYGIGKVGKIHKVHNINHVQDVADFGFKADNFYDGYQKMDQDN